MLKEVRLRSISVALARGHHNISQSLPAYLGLSTLIGMVHKCIVPGCPNQSNRKTDADSKCLKFHRLPFKNQKLLQVWLDLMGMTLTETTVSSRICSAHFF